MQIPLAPAPRRRRCESLCPSVSRIGTHSPELQCDPTDLTSAGAGSAVTWPDDAIRAAKIGRRRGDYIVFAILSAPRECVGAFSIRLGPAVPDDTEAEIAYWILNAEPGAAIGSDTLHRGELNLVLNFLQVQG
jgi:hypothetical protein